MYVQSRRAGYQGASRLGCTAGICINGTAMLHIIFRDCTAKQIKCHAMLWPKCDAWPGCAFIANRRRRRVLQRTVMASPESGTVAHLACGWLAVSWLSRCAFAHECRIRQNGAGACCRASMWGPVLLSAGRNRGGRYRVLLQGTCAPAACRLVQFA